MNKRTGQLTLDRGGLLWPPLIQGVLIKRYKRFLADVRLRNNHIVTAHCPNTGSMRACSEPGRPVYLSPSNNPKRRFRYTWETIEMSASLAGVNTQVPNLLVKTSILHGKIKSLAQYIQVQAEVSVGQHSRLDLLLARDNGERCFIEIKNCTLVEEGVAYFPDAVTTRGRKHLVELTVRSKKEIAVLFFISFSVWTLRSSNQPITSIRIMAALYVKPCGPVWK